MHTKTNRYIAGALFAAAPCLYIIGNIGDGYEVSEIMLLGSLVLCAAACFSDKSVFMIIGAGAFLVCAGIVYIPSFIREIKFLTPHFYSFPFLIRYIAHFIAAILFFIAALVKKNSVILSICSALMLCFAETVFSLLISISYSIPFFNAFPGFLVSIFWVILALAIFFYGRSKVEPKGAESALKAASGNAAVSSNSVLEQLMQLKSLLDMGAITQEEFDAKKAEFLSR